MTIRVSAGTLESNDILITLEIKPIEEGITIDLESIVLTQFGDSIKEMLLTIVKTKASPCGLRIKAMDKGALPYTIEARMLTALSRAKLLQGEI